MNANFFDAPPDPATNPSGFQQQRNMAAQLMRQGAAAPQGSMAGGQYVAPAPTAYAQQLASALAGGYKQDQMRDAARASNLLNGGNGAVTPIQKIGNLIGGPV